MKLVARLKKIEEEMLSLKDQCRELLAAKQVIVSNCAVLDPAMVDCKFSRC